MKTPAEPPVHVRSAYPIYTHTHAKMGKTLAKGNRNKLKAKTNRSGPSNWENYTKKIASRTLAENEARLKGKTVPAPAPAAPPLTDPRTPERKPKEQDMPTLWAAEEPIFVPVPGGRLVCSCCGSRGVVGLPEP